MEISSLNTAHYAANAARLTPDLYNYEEWFKNLHYDLSELNVHINPISGRFRYRLSKSMPYNTMNTLGTSKPMSEGSGSFAKSRKPVDLA